MSNLPVILQQINECFDLEIIPVNNISMGNVQLDREIYNRILARTENNFGAEMLQFSMSPESYMRYKNGKVSSIIKGDTGFKSHEGFETIKMVTIVDTIFTEVSQYLTNKILLEFQQTTNNIFSLITTLQNNLLNQALYFKEQEHVEDMASFQDFFNEINDELGDISCSSSRCSAYISNIILIRQKLYKTYNYFIGKMLNWPNKIYATDFNGNYHNIDLIELQNDYLFCRQAISSYMITLVYEYIISGNINDKSRDKVINKIQIFLKKFKNADSQIMRALNTRDSANKTWNWHYRQDKKYDSDSIGWFLNQCNNDSDFEVTKIKEVFDHSKSILKSISLAPNK